MCERQYGGQVAPACVIGVDLGGTKVLAGAVARDGRVLARARRVVGGLGRDAVLELVAEAVREAAAGGDAAPARGGHLPPVAIGIPGFLDADGSVRRCVHLPIEGLRFADALGELLRAPVLVDNDANCAGVAEARLGAGRGHASMLLLTVGTGIGGAIVRDGALERGATGAAGEFGHMPVDLDGPVCTCGSRGCLETLASGPALVAAALAHGWSDAEPVSGALITEHALRGESVALAAAAQVGRALGAGVAGLVNAFDPDVVVVGGGVLGLGDLLLEPARIEARARALAGDRVRIEPAALGEEAGMVGAGLLAWDGVAAAGGSTAGGASASAGGSTSPGGSAPPGGSTSPGGSAPGGPS
jgi:glucokinase